MQFSAIIKHHKTLEPTGWTWTFYGPVTRSRPCSRTASLARTNRNRRKEDDESPEQLRAEQVDGKDQDRQREPQARAADPRCAGYSGVYPGALP